MLSSPVRWDANDWFKVGISIAGVAAVALADKPVKTQVLHVQSGLHLTLQIGKEGVAAKALGHHSTVPS